MLDRVKNIMMNQLNENKSMIANSFSDIESLRQNLQPLVIYNYNKIEIAQKIRAKLNTQTENSELNNINQVLLSIGFIDPVTKETAGNDYIEQLTIQLNEFFVVKQG